MNHELQKKQSQVKRPDEKGNPRRKWERWYFGFSICMLLLSLGILVFARRVATERIRIPFDGVRLNTPISSGTTTITVSNVHAKPATKRFAAANGYEYLVLTITVRNNGEKPLNVFPTSDTYIKTSDGKVSYVAPYDLASPFHSGTILPGESTEGELSYVVPKQGSYKFYIEASWSGGVVPFMVQSAEKHKRDAP